MTTEQINYEAVLMDLKSKKAQVEAAIAAIEMIVGASGGNPGGGGGGGSRNVGPSDYLGLSIPDAAKKRLSSVRQKQSTQDIMKALEAGGLPSSKYTTVYSILRRREKQVGDIINMQGDWALAEWYPNHRKRTKEEEGMDSDETEEVVDEKATA